MIPPAPEVVPPATIVGASDANASKKESESSEESSVSDASSKERREKEANDFRNNAIGQQWLRDQLAEMVSQRFSQMEERNNSSNRRYNDDQNDRNDDQRQRTNADNDYNSNQRRNNYSDNDYNDNQRRNYNNDNDYNDNQRRGNNSDYDRQHGQWGNPQQYRGNPSDDNRRGQQSNDEGYNNPHDSRGNNTRSPSRERNQQQNRSENNTNRRGPQRDNEESFARGNRANSAARDGQSNQTDSRGTRDANTASRRDDQQNDAARRPQQEEDQPPPREDRDTDRQQSNRNDSERRQHDEDQTRQRDDRDSERHHDNQPESNRPQQRDDDQSRHRDDRGPTPHQSNDANRSRQQEDNDPPRQRDDRDRSTRDNQDNPDTREGETQRTTTQQGSWRMQHDDTRDRTDGPIRQRSSGRDGEGQRHDHDQPNSSRQMQEGDDSDRDGRSRRRRSPPGGGQQSRKRESTPHRSNAYYPRSPSVDREYNPWQESRNRDTPRVQQRNTRQQAVSPTAPYGRDPNGRPIIDYEEQCRAWDRAQAAGGGPGPYNPSANLSAPTPIRPHRGSPHTMSFTEGMGSTPSVFNSTSLGESNQAMSTTLGTDRAVASTALQTLYILSVNNLGIIGSQQAQEFYEHSQRWSNNYTIAEVLSTKAQKAISDQIGIDQEYPYPAETRRNWLTSLTVPQVAALVHRYFRGDLPPGKSLAEKVQALHFAFCYNRRDIEMQVITKFRECVDTHVQQHGELTSADHAALTLIIEKKLPLHGAVTRLYKAAKAQAQACARPPEPNYLEAIHLFFRQVNTVRGIQAQSAEYGDADSTYCDIIEGNPYGAVATKASITRAPALPALVPLRLTMPVANTPCNSCGHLTHVLEDCPHLWMIDSNTSHSVKWEESNMGKLWFTHGHSQYTEHASLPGVTRFRIETPPRQTHFAADPVAGTNHPNSGGGYKPKYRKPQGGFGENAKSKQEGYHNRGPNRGGAGRGAPQPASYYERTYVPFVATNAVLASTHVDMSSTTPDSSVLMTDPQLLLAVQQQETLEDPPPQPLQVDQSNETVDTALPNTGTQAPDIILAAMHLPVDHTEYLQLTVYQDERRTSQGNAPTDALSPSMPSGRRLESQALLDTGSMAGDFVSKSLVVSLNALNHCYASPVALNVCSGLDGTCYKSDTLIDLGIDFPDDNNINRTIFITFSVNPLAQIDLIIGRRSLNLHNLFVLTPKRMGFNPALVSAVTMRNDLEPPLRASSTSISVSQNDTCCSHHSVGEEPCSSCRNHRLATEGADLGDGGPSIIHQIPTMENEGSPSLDVTGSGLGQAPPATGTNGPTPPLNTASVMPSGINLCGDEIDDEKTDAFGPFLSALLREPTPIGNDFDIISTITFEGDYGLQKACRDLCYEFKDIFRNEVAKEPARIPPFEIHPVLKQWQVPKNRGALRQLTAEASGAVRDNLAEMLAAGVVEKSQAAYYSHPVVVRKGPGQFRVCLDFRPLNECTEDAGWNIPDIAEMFTRIGDQNPDIFGVMDLTAGYHQAPLSEASKIFTAFMCFAGIYQFTRLPFGLKRAPSYFQEMMATVVLVGLVYISCEIYLDDCIVYGTGEEQFLKRLREVFERFRDKNLFLKAKKCKFGVKRIEYVGRVISKEGLSMSQAKIQSVLDFPRPKTLTTLRGFLGLANYFRGFVPNHSHVVAPMHKMTVSDGKRQAKVDWTEESIKAFHDIKVLISECPLMHFIDKVSPIHLYTDASDYGVGGALFQCVDGKMKPISFISKSLSTTQLNWSTIQKEAFGIFVCCVKLNPLLRDRKFIIHTDHKNLVYMKTSPSSMVGRWFMALQELDFTIQYVKGKDNVVADAMSRLCPNLMELTISPSPDTSGLQPDNLPGPFCGALEAIPDMTEEQREAIHMCHNRFVGHGGLDRTVEKLLLLPMQWKGMKQHVHLFIRQCACCQKMNATRVPIHVHKYVTSAYQPFHVLNIDFIGPFPDSSYVLVIICAFTRWTELYWCADSTAQSATDCLLQQFGRFGAPQMIRSDRGSHFANDLVKQFLIATNTPHNLTLAYSKQENAIVERVNKEVNRYLRAFLYDTNDIHKYKSCLPFIQRILNSSIHSSTNASPASLLFGNRIDLNLGILSPFPQLPETETPASTVICEMYHIQDTLIAQAQTALRTMDEMHMANNPGEITVFPVDSYVLAKYPTQPPTRLHTLWRGPFRVKSIHNSDYTLFDITTKKFKCIHVSNLKEFVFDPRHTDPADVARRDYMEFFIESIVQHKGHPRRKSDMKFLVKWLNFDDTHNTWELWHNLRLTDALHDYLRLHGMSKLIPIDK